MGRITSNYKLLKASAVAAAWLGRFSERLSAAPARVLWFTPWEVPVSDRGLAKQAKWLEATDLLVFETEVGRIAAFGSGSGPVVLLVHGWGERAAALGGFVAPLVKAGYRVVGIDLPAHGDSSGRTTNIIQSGEAIAEIAQQLGGVHAVVAHSMGAHCALWAMTRCGFEPERAVFIAPNIDFSHAFETFQEMFSLPKKAISGLKRSIERRFGAGLWLDMRGDVLAVGLDVPGLVFHDPDDPVVPFGGSRDLLITWRTARLVEVTDTGHGHIKRNPDVIARTVAFVSKFRPEELLMDRVKNGVGG
ncbi:MAG: hypothetical protein QOG16_1351 [Actinomycetota bacterium]|nr:hypothetical protein [Actinomycetota bacterium]